MRLIPFDPTDTGHLDAVVETWNAACGADLAIGRRMVQFVADPMRGVAQIGLLALVDEQPAGFVLASYSAGRAHAAPIDLGWIDAVAVRPERQRRGVGGALLDLAEEWLADNGRARAQLGGSLKPFAPGLPATLGSEDFFTRRGYHLRPGHVQEWDLAHDLAGYAPPAEARRAHDITCAPLPAGQEDALLDFLGREFPGRWLYEAEEGLQAGEQPGDFLVLHSPRGIDGFCRVTTENSWWPVHRFHPGGLPRPWGQLGPIGISRDRRGLGYGAALLDAGLRHLQGLGVRGCIIDWTGLTGFYGKFGFTPFRAYRMLVKSLVDS